MENEKRVKLLEEHYMFKMRNLPSNSSVSSITGAEDSPSSPVPSDGKMLCSVDSSLPVVWKKNQKLKFNRKMLLPKLCVTLSWLECSLPSR